MDLNRVEDTSPAEFFVSFRSCRSHKSKRRAKKEEFMEKHRQSEIPRAFIIAAAALISVLALPKTRWS
jgi:hypothetical protein